MVDNVKTENNCTESDHKPVRLIMEMTHFLRRGKEESNRKEYLDNVCRRSRSWVEGSPDVFSTAH